MSNFAVAAVRGSSKDWSAAEVDLSRATDIDEVADRLRDVDADAEVSVLFVESDDSYLVIMRLDDGEDLRIFGSDSAFIEENRLGAVLLGDIEGPASGLEEVADVTDSDDDDELPAPSPDADPVGDADLLADLGVPAQQLLALCAQEGMLPADITSEITAVMGCANEVEELREV